MPRAEYFREHGNSHPLDPARLDELIERVGREVGEGLLPSAQMAIAHGGKIVAMRTFGTATFSGRSAPATNDSLYAVFSTTKAVTSSAAWLLIESSELSPQERVADIIEGFEENDKGRVLVEHLFTHTAGFPYAPFQPLEWPDRDRRLARFRSWRLNWETGSRFEYHPTATMWVLAHIIEVRSRQRFEDFVRRRIAEPLGLPDLRVGCPPGEQHRIADVVHVGEEPSAEELEAIGMNRVVETEAVRVGYLALNDAAVRQIPIPGGGGFTTAGDVALFYQALLAGGRASGGAQVWKSETIADALRIRTGELREPWFDKLANRALGLIIAGDDERAFRGFAPTSSPQTFGHNGAGGQIAWADPASGVSFAYCTNGFDRNPIRQARRGASISQHAARCVA